MSRAATATDRVVVDFKGFMDGEPMENADAKEFPLELDGGRMIPGFEDGLVGSQAGDERTLELSFPEGYQEASLAGRPARFEVTVHKVEEAALPELDDEFAKGYDFETIDALKEELQKRIGEQKVIVE